MQLDFRKLPHWARVAFAARCARLTIPIFEENWPDAAAEYRDQYLASITGSERVGANGHLTDVDFPLDYISAGVAGRAQIPHICPYELDDDQGPSPKDAKAAARASLAAKVAEYAERTARSTLDDSAKMTSETWRFLGNVIVEADRWDIVGQLEEEFETLVRTSRGEKWSDSTPVPPEVFDREVPLHRNWWKFW